MDIISSKQYVLPEKFVETFMILELLNDPILVTDRLGDIILWNTAMEALSGYEKSEALQKNPEAFLTGYRRNEKHLDVQLVRKDGGLIDAELSLSKMNIEGVEYTAIVVHDISSLKSIQSHLEVTLQHSKDIADSAPIGILTCDEEGNILYLNSMVVKLLGSPSIEETKKINLFTFPLLVESGFSERLMHCLNSDTHINYELNYQSKWGRRIWLNIHNKPFLSRNRKIAMIILDDLTERKNFEDQLTSLSFTDTLTGIYNRRYFEQKAEEEILLARRLNRTFSIIMLDLDHFKAINDNHGHEVGDMVLKTVTAQISEKIRKTDILARWGGEEFVILLNDISCRQADGIAEKLRKHLMNTVIPNVGSVSASFGISTFQDGDTVEELIRRADKMLYCAKLDGRNCVKS